MNQIDFSEIVGCSEVTIQAVERGPERLKLSEALATKIALATGVSIEWLLANDPSRPPEGRFGVPYTKDYYDEWRAAVEAPPRALSSANSAGYLFGFYEIGRRVLDQTNTEKMELAYYRLTEFYRGFVKEFTGQESPYLPALGGTTLDLVERDLQSAKELGQFLIGKAGNVSQYPEVQKIAADLKSHLNGKPRRDRTGVARKTTKG